MYTNEGVYDHCEDDHQKMNDLLYILWLFYPPNPTNIVMVTEHQTQQSCIDNLIMTGSQVYVEREDRFPPVWTWKRHQDNW